MKFPKRGVAKFGQALLVLHEYDEDKVRQLVSDLRREFGSWHQASITVKEFTQGPVTDQAIAVRLMSESLDDLERVAADLSLFIAKLDGTINLDNPIGQANTELALTLDYDKAGLAGIDINTLDNTVQTILTGAFVGRFNDDNGEDYPIVVRRTDPDIDGLADVHIQSRSGEFIPLSQVARQTLKKGHSEFFHYQKLRMAKVSADVAPGYSVHGLTAKVVAYLDQYNMPPGMYYTLGGRGRVAPGKLCRFIPDHADHRHRHLCRAGVAVPVVFAAADHIQLHSVCHGRLSDRPLSYRPVVFHDGLYRFDQLIRHSGQQCYYFNRHRQPQPGRRSGNYRGDFKRQRHPVYAHFTHHLNHYRRPAAPDPVWRRFMATARGGDHFRLMCFGPVQLFAGADFNPVVYPFSCNWHFY